MTNRAEHISAEDLSALQALEARLKTLLPEEYQESYEDLQPVSMGSAGLKFDARGKVAWNEMWATFCDLAMAGGPPHKGTWLGPASAAEIQAQAARYAEVVGEMCRGVQMVTGLVAKPSPRPGWVRVICLSEAMAGWLSRAIVMENVAARSHKKTIELPAGPAYRLEKEIKNVVTVMSKTCHYWVGHMPKTQQHAIGRLFAAMAEDLPPVEPDLARDAQQSGHDAIAVSVNKIVKRETGLQSSTLRSSGWMGVECRGVRAAVWMMRALTASNVFARREATTLFVPINPERDPGGAVVTSRLVLVYRLAAARGVGVVAADYGTDNGNSKTLPVDTSS